MIPEAPVLRDHQNQKSGASLLASFEKILESYSNRRNHRRFISFELKQKQNSLDDLLNITC